MIALALQIAGFALAIVFLFLHHCDLFVIAFGVHVAGDALFVAQNGLPKMNFLDKLSNFVKLPAFLQFVGLMLLALLFFLSHASGPLKFVAFIAFGISLAGFVYEKIYP